MKQEFRRYAIIISIIAIILTGCSPTPSHLDRIENNPNAEKINESDKASSQATPQENVNKESNPALPSEKTGTSDRKEDETVKPSIEKPSETKDEKESENVEPTVDQSKESKDGKETEPVAPSSKTIRVPEWLKDHSFKGIDGRMYEFDEDGTMSGRTITETSDDGNRITYSDKMVVSFLSDKSITIETTGMNTKAFRDNGSQEWLNGTSLITDNSKYEIELEFNEVGRPKAKEKLVSVIEQSTGNDVIIAYYNSNGELEERYHLRKNPSNTASVTLVGDDTIINGRKLKEDIHMYIANRGAWWLEDENMADDGKESFEFDRNGLIDQGSTEFGYADKMYTEMMSDTSVSYILIRGKEKARVEISRIEKDGFSSYRYVEYRIGTEEPIKTVEGLELV